MDHQTTYLFNIVYNSDDKSKETESGAEKLAATQPSSMEETTDPRKLQTDVGVSDHNDSDEGCKLIQKKVNLVIMRSV